MTADRYAIYFAPAPDGALWRFGSGVLGYDAATGEDVPQLVPDGFDPAAFRALTADPRLYGFHATIKAPFRLREGRSEAELVAALESFARGRSAFILPELVVTAIPGGPHAASFIALTEPRPTPALLALERAAVEGFEPFRAPLTEAEIARRRPESLSERGRRYLHAYGYPHVLDAFRFHMTLTGRVPGLDAWRAVAGLTALRETHALPAQATFDAPALFRQRAGERFRIIARAALGKG